MTTVQNEKNMSNQLEDVKELIPMYKELTPDEKIYINHNAALSVMLCVEERSYGITNLGESCGQIRESKRSV